ncbi:hypothetical protein LCGC14_0475990 [marine sediment metagenome]|uniref:Uncharacterized protein n=1 Tax=marine sediment metagenome TaxID=412755 RepID=A0A0F9STN0_9ZZZZ
MKALNFLIVAVVIIVVFLGGCSPQRNSVKITAQYKDFFSSTDPNSIVIDPNMPVLIEAHGDAAKPIAEVIANNAKTAQARRNELVGSLTPFYGILFICGLGGLVLIAVLRYLKMPSKWAGIVPVAAFGGMALIHFFNEFAEWLPYAVLVIIIAFFIWKVAEYKKERNVNSELADLYAEEITRRDNSHIPPEELASQE